MKRRNISLLLAVALVISLAAPVGAGIVMATGSQTTFTDVPPNHWAYPYIMYLVEHNIINGYGGGLFGPDDYMERAMFAQILANVDGADLSAYTVSNFNDVDPGDWYAPAVEWVNANEYIQGYGYEEFGPVDKIIREQIAVILMRYADAKGYTLPTVAAPATFNDADFISGWAVDAVNWAQQAGLFIGDDNGNVNPLNTATRGEVAAVIARFMEAVAQEPLPSADMTVVSTKNANNTTGFGAEWDPFFFTDPNTQYLNEDDWNIAVNRIIQMKIQRVRIWIQPNWFEPNNDNNDPNVINWNSFDFNNEQMNSLYRYLDVCQAQGIIVNLTWWGAPTNQVAANPWLSFPDTLAWCGAPNNLDETGENISALLQYLINVKGYSCVQELIIFNEPSAGFYVLNNAIDQSYYFQMYRTVDARLKADGIRDKIKLVGSDDAMDGAWFSKTAANIDDILDMYDSHHYLFDNNKPNASRDLRQYIKDRVKKVTKPYFSAEFGTGNNIDSMHVSDIDTYDRGLFLGFSAINELKSGSTGASYWCMQDIYYSPFGASMMYYGLWKYKDASTGTMDPRPVYYSWGLVNRYTRVKSEVYDITNAAGLFSGVDAVALKSPEGKWTYMIVNNLTVDKDFTFQNDQAAGETMRNYVFSADTLPADDSMIQSNGGETFANGQISFSIPAKSFMVITNLED